MNILFTKSDTLMSKLIRKVTGEPFSHCALRVSGGFIIHVNLLGLQVQSSASFGESNEVVEVVYVDTDWPNVIAAMVGKGHIFYDFGALCYLALRCIMPFLPKKNLWQCSGMYLCTEFVTEVLDSKEDSMITPYKLYLKLANKGE